MTPRAIAEPTPVVARDSVVRDSVVVRDTASANPSCRPTTATRSNRCRRRAASAGPSSGAIRVLNDAYQRLITALRREANVQPSDPDPESVDALREAQRRWTEAGCRVSGDAGSGLLFARARAQSFCRPGGSASR